MHRNQFQSSARVLHATVRNVSKLLLLFHADSFLDLLFSSIFLLILKETKQVKDTLFSSELHFKLVNFSVFLSLDVKEILNQFLLLCFLPKSARFLSYLSPFYVLSISCVTLQVLIVCRSHTSLIQLMSQLPRHFNPGLAILEQ